MSQQPHERLIVTVAPDGTITAETKNIKGTRCLDYIEILEDLLEATTSSSAFTDEYTQSTIDNQHYEVTRDLHQR